MAKVIAIYQALENGNPKLGLKLCDQVLAKVSFLADHIRQFYFGTLDYYENCRNQFCGSVRISSCLFLGVLATIALNPHTCFSWSVFLEYRRQIKFRRGEEGRTSGVAQGAEGRLPRAAWEAQRRAHVARRGLAV